MNSSLKYTLLSSHTEKHDQRARENAFSHCWTGTPDGFADF